jgi:hypothetical protein
MFNRLAYSMTLFYIEGIPITTVTSPDDKQKRIDFCNFISEKQKENE